MGKLPYFFDNSFLPRDGFIFVDTCGPTWMPPGRNSEKHQLVRLEDFNKRLKKRKGVLTTPRIFEEINECVSYFAKSRGAIKNRLERYLEKKGEGADVSGFSKRILYNTWGLREFNRLYSILKNGSMKNLCSDHLKPLFYLWYF